MTEKEQEERIVQAAIEHNGQRYTGYRHYLIQQQIYRETGQMAPREKEGFETSLDRFVSRTEAARIALKAGQIKLPKTELNSEDL